MPVQQDKVVQYHQWPCLMQFGAYSNGVRALQLIHAEEYDPVATITVNPPGNLAADEVAIKDWSENEGALEWAIAQGLVHEPHRLIPSGHVVIPVCRVKDWPEPTAARGNQ